MSSFDNNKPYVLSKAFVFPGRVNAIATSQTLHGISMKALLGQWQYLKILLCKSAKISPISVSTSLDQIIAIPRRFLDPRRPMHKPTKADAEEYLVPYDPVIPVEPKWTITHTERVAGISRILTSPTILESTSQVFAFGLDIFGSSVSPSGRFDVLSKDFNKIQLIATTLGLLGAVAIMRPIVQKKQLKERWYSAT